MTTSLLPYHSAYLRKSALNCKKILNCKKFAVNSHLHIFLFYSLFNPRRKNLRKSIIREKSYHHYAYILIMKRKINFLTEYRLLSKFCTIFIQFEGQKGRWRMHISSRNSLHNYSFSCIYFIDCLCHYVKLQHQNMTYWRRHSCKIQISQKFKKQTGCKDTKNCRTVIYKNAPYIIRLIDDFYHLNLHTLICKIEAENYV
jgi:hypothetical protein